MTLLVIGSGFGRTGTRSVKDALEHLGFGPCHHMYEVIDHPGQVAHWQALARGETPDWDEVFSGYRSQIDWPGAHYWRELAQAYPQSRVIHTVRPEERWWASFSASIAKLSRVYPDLPLPPHAKDILDAWMTFAGRPTFGDGIENRDSALAAYRLRTEQVKAAIPAERLLVFDVAQGWEPLARFLGVPVPAGPFPHRNLRADFWDVVGGEPA